MPGSWGHLSLWQLWPAAATPAHSGIEYPYIGSDWPLLEAKKEKVEELASSAGDGCGACTQANSVTATVDNAPSVLTGGTVSVPRLSCGAVEQPRTFTEHTVFDLY